MGEIKRGAKVRKCKRCGKPSGKREYCVACAIALQDEGATAEQNAAGEEQRATALASRDRRLRVLAVIIGAITIAITAYVYARKREEDARHHAEIGTIRGVPPPLEVQALAMARALRSFYPFAREADDAADAARECVSKQPSAAKACASSYVERLTAIDARLPSTIGLEGCAFTVARATGKAIDDALGAARKSPAGDWSTGIDFSAMHESYRECITRLFRCGGLNHPTEACTPANVEGHLGLRDDEPPGPATYAKPRPGHLWLADDQEIDRETLQIK